MSCTICFDAFNATTRKSICCPVDSCSKTACRTCYQTFLCGDDVTVPKCMFCNTQFTHSQIQRLGFTRSFLQGEFAKHQQDVLFAQEQAMLPAAQVAAAHDRLVKSIDDQIKDVAKQIKQLQALKIDLTRTKYQLLREGPIHDDAPTHQFIHRCADSDCNGFVSSAWKCATCDKHTCSQCRELKAAHNDHDHICNPDTLASVALLKTSTKPCPNCKVPVHKTDGCDQMFCTQCKRLWSWNTGKFETRGHNPHYLQWMRDTHPAGMPRDPGDVLCGREIDPHFLTNIHTLIKNSIASGNHSKELAPILAMLSSIPHLRHHDLPRFQLDPLAINLHARKAFVSNALSLPKFKQTIRRNHLLAIKNENIAQILHAVIQATTDIAFRFLHQLQTTKNIDARSFAAELFNLKQYANHELALIHNDFHSPPSLRFFFSHYNFKLQTFISMPKHSFHAIEADIKNTPSLHSLLPLHQLFR